MGAVSPDHCARRCGAMVHAATFNPVAYQLRVTPKYVAPPIWRRLHVPGRFILAQLHDIIQVAMGWEDDHLHGFDINLPYSPPRSGPSSPFGTIERNERKVRLAEVVNHIDAVLGYTYDFGDSWHHIIEVEDVAEPDTDTRRAVCLAGERLPTGRLVAVSRGTIACSMSWTLPTTAMTSTSPNG